MKPNALIVTTQGILNLVEIDFSIYEGLYRAIGVKRVSTLHTRCTQGISSILGVHIVGFCDRYGELNHSDENTIAAQATGYDMLRGDVVFCRADNYFTPLPLKESDALALKNYLAKAFYPLGYPW